MGVKTTMAPRDALVALAAAFPGEGFTLTEQSDGSFEVSSDAERAPVDIQRALNGAPAAAKDAAWAELRAERSRRLAASDWTQLPDVPAAVRASWATYRQALRDLPARTTNPHAASWPTPPA